MKKLTEKSRRLLRNVYRCVGAAAVSVLFQACYGVIQDIGDDVAISGTVRCKETNATIPGIDVSIQGEETFQIRTCKDGTFSFFVPWQELFTLEFNDVDGTFNGGLFQTQTTDVQTDFRANLDIFLDKEVQ